MDTSLIRTIDLLAGKPVCASLSILERTRRSFRRAPTASPKKILFIKLIEMGSTVLAVPAFEEATRMVGRENIYILVFESNRKIVDILPCFEPRNVITIDDSSLAHFTRGLAAAVERIRRLRIDTAIDMEGLTRSSAIITYLTGARNRVGFHNFSAEGPYRGRLFTHELGYTFQHHVSEMFLSLVKALEAPPDEVPRLKEPVSLEGYELPRFAPSGEELAEIRALLKTRSGRAVPGGNPRVLSGGPIVILNPNCGDLLPLRKWPEDCFVALGRRFLQNRDDVTLIVTGNRSEEDASEALASTIGPPHRVISVAGHTTLRQLLTLYTLSDLLISSDSGPCHFAALTTINIVSLFGPETPLLYAPLGKRVTTITADLACSPCLNILNHRLSLCQENRCMRGISVERVYQAATAALEARARAADTRTGAGEARAEDARTGAGEARAADARTADAETLAGAADARTADAETLAGADAGVEARGGADHQSRAS